MVGAYTIMKKKREKIYITLSMAWMTPLVAIMSASLTLAPALSDTTFTTPPLNT